MPKVDWYANENYPFRFSMCMPMDLPKDTCYAHCFNMLLQDALQIFDIKNMPETFDRRFFFLTLLLTGRIAIFRDNMGDLRALNMKSASKPNIYYVPEKVLITNPTFKGISYTLTLGEDVTVIYCTSIDQYQYGLESGGLYSLISITATLLADNLVSINTAQKNMRLHKLLGADDQLTVKSIEEAMAKMYYGRPFQVVQKSLLDQLADIPMQDTSGSASLITQLIQANQYIKAGFFERIGFVTHDQMKKERLITAEAEQGAEMAIFNIMDMLQNIKKGLEEANAMFDDLDLKIEINPLVLSNLGITQEQFDAGDFQPRLIMDDQADGEPDPEPADDQADGEPDPEPADDQADGEPDPEPADDQADDESDPEPADDQADGEPDPEPADDQADGEPDPDPEEDQADGEPEADADLVDAAADLVDAAADLVDAAADMVDAAADDQADGEPDPDPEEDPKKKLDEAAAAYKARRRDDAT